MTEPFERIKYFAQQHLSAIEFWPTYFERRYLEFLNYLDFFPSLHLGDVLEIGCAIGYHSSFLSQIARSVTATDLENPEIVTHASGLRRAQSLISQLGIENIKLVPASAEQLPFPDRSFDFVYSSWVFQYIPDQAKAVEEVYRVLRPGGYFFCVVPTRMNHVLRFFEFHSYILSRVWVRGLQLFCRPKLEPKKNELNGVRTASAERAKKSSLSSYPFPRPQGAARSWFMELRDHSASKWQKTFEAGGRFSVVCQGATLMSPAHQLLGMFSPQLAIALFRKTRLLEKRLGSARVLRFAAIDSVIVLQKR